MARREQDREDLLAEATALRERVSLLAPGDAEPTVVGFRRDGGASFYFGAARVYQFTAAGALRRAFVGELLYKASEGRLHSLRRQRTDAAVHLVSHALDEAEATALLADMHNSLAALKKALATGRARTLGQVPPEVDVAARVLTWLTHHAGPIPIARSPRAG
jgi:hypothetical protein